MCSPTCAVTTTIQGWWPPPVCSGTGWLPAAVQGNAGWYAGGKYRCGICGQEVEVDTWGRLVLHPYIPKVA